MPVPARSLADDAGALVCKPVHCRLSARVAKLVDAGDLKSPGSHHPGSTPGAGTTPAAVGGLIGNTFGMAREPTLLEQALQRGRVTVSGGVATWVVDGQGAAAMPADEWRSAEKWAASRRGGINAARDRAVLLERITTIVTRSGTTFTTLKGSQKSLDQLHKAMKGGGFDLNEWRFPADEGTLRRRPKADNDAKPSSTPSAQDARAEDGSHDTPQT